MGDSYYYGVHSFALSVAAKSYNQEFYLERIVKQKVLLYADNIKSIITNTVLQNNGNYDLESWIGGVDSLDKFYGKRKYKSR